MILNDLNLDTPLRKDLTYLDCCFRQNEGCSERAIYALAC